MRLVLLHVLFYPEYPRPSSIFPTNLQAITMSKRTLVEGAAMTAAIVGTAGTAAGLTLWARGDMRGAPGMSHALSRLGKLANGGMTEGLALAAGTGALVGITLYRGVRALAD